MAKSRIPKSARKSLKRARLEDAGTLSESTRKGINKSKRSIREGIQKGDIQRTKISWTVDVGDLVRVKQKNQTTGLTASEGASVHCYGIVTYKRTRITYSNQEDEYIIIMTPHQSEMRLHPKAVETIQEV